MKLGKLKAAFEPHKNKRVLLHFRIRTNGKKSPENTHPFRITDNLIFAHNGILYKMPYHEKKSDTYMFNELLLQNIVRVYGPEILNDPLMQPLFEGYTFGSKLVFMDNKGKITIWNEKSGYWENSCWFSNDSYKSYPKPIYIPNDEKHIDLGFHREQGLYSLPYSPSGLKPMIMGDYVRVIVDHPVAKLGWVGKIMGFYENRSVEVYFPMYKRSLRLHLLYIDTIEVTKLPPPTDIEIIEGEINNV